MTWPLYKNAVIKKGFDFEQDLFNMIGYIRPISKAMTAEGAIPVIKPVLKSAYLEDDPHVEGEDKILPEEQLEKFMEKS